MAAAAPPGPDRYLEVAGARLRYRDSGSGPALVLVHGWTLDLDMWEPQVERLCDRFRLVRLDRRGHGLSSGDPGPQQDVSDLAMLCRHLRLNRIALLGMSQGARSVLAFADAAPDTVRAVVLDGAPDLRPEAAGNDIPLAHFQQVLRAQGIAAFRREWRSQPAMQLQTDDPAARALLDAMLGRYDGRDLRDDTALAKAAMPLRLEQIAAPALVLNGESDMQTRAAAADYLHEQLPQAERHLVARAGHLPNLDNPDEYAQLCRAFLMRQLHGSVWR
ncbi:MAG TPA: alpha/beta hydrolase [Steroidobacteraceae bacterium]|nr:alpha/beta hydrolase [Steroidobacteraceae bacterium]